MFWPYEAVPQQLVCCGMKQIYHVMIRVIDADFMCKIMNTFKICVRNLDFEVCH
jgi:hypothetical protein